MAGRLWNWSRVGFRGAQALSRRPLLQTRRGVGSQSGLDGGSTTWLMVAAAGAFGVAAYTLYRGNRTPRPLVLVERKKEGYEKSGAVHPEAVAEEQLTSQPQPSQTAVEATPPTPPPPPDQVPYLLIGGGTASFSAAQAIRERDPAAKVLIVTDEQFTPYSRPPLSKHLWLGSDHEAARQLRFAAPWAGGKMVDVFYSAEFCAPHELNEREEGGLAVLTGTKVVSLDSQKKTVSLDTGHVMSFDKCLLATGGRPKTLPLFNATPENLRKNVSVYRKIPDFQSLDKLLEKKEAVLVVGGGFLGTELAVGIASRYHSKGLKVLQLFPEAGNLGLVLPPALASWTMEKVKKEGVEVYPNTAVAKVESDGNKLRLTTSGDSELCVDHVVVAVGLNPNTELASSARLETDPVVGGFRVNSELMACTDIWAAGDVCSFFDPYLGRRRVEHHDHAQVSGRLAGANMAGAHQQFEHQSMFWSDVGPEVGFEATGLISADLPTLGIYPRKEGEETGLPIDDHSKGVVFYLSKEERRVVGVLTWNLFGKMDVARKIIAEGKTEKEAGELACQFDLRPQQ